jgi:DNA invertase Pin-like site-specific DNA recombinase
VPKFTAVYVRVSTAKQDTRSQEPDLRRWAEAQDEPMRWFVDKASGKSMDRPAWNKLDEAIRLGKVARVVVWRLDRLGRTASGLTALFDVLTEKGVGLVSLKDGFTLDSPAGRLQARILASVAEFETEVRAERIRAGQEAARANGKTWGGSKPGVRKKVTPTQEKAIVAMRKDGETILAISKAVKLSRPTIYSVLADAM